MATEQLTVSILGRDYRVACRVEEKDELIACAHYVDQKMGALRGRGKVLGADRLAVMAALQIAQELLSARSRAEEVPLAEARRRLQELAHQVDEMLAPQEKLF